MCDFSVFKQYIIIRFDHFNHYKRTNCLHVLDAKKTIRPPQKKPVS